MQSSSEYNTYDAYDYVGGGTPDLSSGGLGGLVGGGDGDHHLLIGGGAVGGVDQDGQALDVNFDDPKIASFPRLLLMGPRRGGKTSIQVRWSKSFCESIFGFISSFANDSKKLTRRLFPTPTLFYVVYFWYNTYDGAKIFVRGWYFKRCHRMKRCFDLRQLKVWNAPSLIIHHYVDSQYGTSPETITVRMMTNKISSAGQRH